MDFPLAERIFNFLPLPLLALGILFLLVVAFLGGGLARRRWNRSFGVAAYDSTKEGYIVSAVLGLLALLLGFTFSMALDRHDQRLWYVVDEANSISSTYLLAQTFKEPDRSRISNLLVDYVDVRLAAAQPNERAKTAELLEQSGKLQTQLWAASLAATYKVRDDISSTFLQNMYQTFDIGSSREAVRRARIPIRVHVVLVLYMTTTAWVLGFAFAGSPRYVASGTLLVLLTLSIVLIFDLDRPTSGAIIEAQRPMEDAKKRLTTNTPAGFERLARQVTPSVDRQGGLSGTIQKR